MILGRWDFFIRHHQQFCISPPPQENFFLGERERGLKLPKLRKPPKKKTRVVPPLSIVLLAVKTNLHHTAAVLL